MVLMLVPILTSWIFKILSFTMKFKEIHPEIIQKYWNNMDNAIVAFWHGRLLMTPYIYRGKKGKALVSQHKDGELIARALEKMGIGTIRGSSTRGGSQALRSMIRDLKSGYDIAIVPDGSQGPRYKVQRGVVELAKLSGTPIIPLTFSSSKKIIFKSWDAFMLPYPFSRGVFLWGEPIYVENKDEEGYFEKKRLEVERKLCEITEFVDNYYKK